MAKRRNEKKKRRYGTKHTRVSFVNGQLQVVFREGINKDRRSEEDEVQQLKPKSLAFESGQLEG